jgi:hypothetical protein
MTGQARVQHPQLQVLRLLMVQAGAPTQLVVGEAGAHHHLLPLLGA